VATLAESCNMPDNFPMKALVLKRVLIRGEMWQIRVIPDEHFFEKYGSKCAGITLLDKKVIDVPVQEVNFVTILHEIFHAYAAYLHLSSANIEGDQAEEIFAELVSSYAIQMINLATSVTESFGKRLKIEHSALVANLSEDQKVFTLLKMKQKKKLRKQPKKKT
jgi:hypothetical protein